MIWRRMVLFLMVLAPCSVLAAMSPLSTLWLTVLSFAFGFGLRGAIVALTPGEDLKEAAEARGRKG